MRQLRAAGEFSADVIAKLKADISRAPSPYFATVPMHCMQPQ
jgi:hypothetical protein